MNGRDQSVLVGTRGSALARAQTEQVEQALRGAWPDLAIAIKVITTRGDESSASAEKQLDPEGGRKGMFTADIEHALKTNEIDIAVHSAKDLPSETTPAVEITGVLPRAPAEDVLIMKASGGFVSLRQDALVATGSARRAHQLRAKRGDVQIVPLRGNVPTRLRKFAASDWDAVVLARAGLERLGFQPAQQTIAFEGTKLWTELLACADFLPAGGQGIIALQTRSEDERTRKFVRRINHLETCLCLQAEREFLRLLQGDCDSPVGVLATIEESEMRLRAEVFEPDSGARRHGEVRGNPEQYEPLAAELMRRINAG